VVLFLARNRTARPFFLLGTQTLFSSCGVVFSPKQHWEFFSCCSVFKAAMGNLFLRLGTLIENFQGRKRR
jgi:hypothetical protein